MTDQKCPGLTVGKLRKALEGLSGDLEIVIRFSSDENDVDICGGILGAGVEHAHDEDDTEFFAIDCTDDDERFDDEGE